MSKHTPGPWWQSGLDVGTVPFMHVKVARVSGANRAEAEANSRLIAAAPELLQELYAAAAQIEALGGDARTQRAAIAKATGGAA